MSSWDFDCIVVGAGVVGMACARALALAGRQTAVIEAEDRAGEGISSRNSGVIHAGLYYPDHSLKARLCVRGRDLLYALCGARNIAHRRTGKLVVVTAADQLPRLMALQAQAARNTVEVHWLDRAAVAEMEPHLQCVAALWVPSSGLVDVPELIGALLAEFEALGGVVVYRSEVTAVRGLSPGAGWQVELSDGSSVRTPCVINSAGLRAVELARRCQGWPAERTPNAWYARGHYYTSRRPVPFQRLVYPLPDPAGLGVHLGFDLSGRARFGPDLRWCEAPDYHFDDSQRENFARAIQAWWPELEADDLQPDFVGVRPKITGPGMPNADFVIEDGADCGMSGMIHLFGIESPGLTSSLALAEHLATLLTPLR